MHIYRIWPLQRSCLYPWHASTTIFNGASELPENLLQFFLQETFCLVSVRSLIFRSLLMPPGGLSCHASTHMDTRDDKYFANRSINNILYLIKHRPASTIKQEELLLLFFFFKKFVIEFIHTFLKKN